MRRGGPAAAKTSSSLFALLITSTLGMRHFQALPEFPSYALANKCLSWLFPIKNSPSTLLCELGLEILTYAVPDSASSLPILRNPFLPC